MSSPKILLLAPLAIVFGCADERPKVAPADEAETDAAVDASGLPVPNFRVVRLGAAPSTTPEAFAPTAIVEVKGGGLGLIDFDRDGLLDVFVPGSLTLGNEAAGDGARLFQNQGDLKFVRRTDLGFDWKGWGMGVAVGDLDGDGYDDLFTAAHGPNAAHFNRDNKQTAGGRKFVEGAKAAGLDDERWGMAASLGDLDNDGDLDLYVANYLNLDLDNLPPDTTYLEQPIFAGPLGLTPTADLILRNRGDGTFEDKSFRSGIGTVEPSFGLGATTIDLNEDGLLDIFVGNDSMANFLFVNQGAFSFEDKARSMGLAVNGDGREQATMGIAISDVSGDGLPDFFSTNFASDTNTLLVARQRPSGGLSFRDRTSSLGASKGSRSLVGWASLFGDFDLDGDEDLVVFNGHVYPERLASKMGSTSEQAPLYYAQSSGRYQQQTVAQAGQWLAETALFRGAARGDLDNDGAMDLVVTALGQQPMVLAPALLDPAESVSVALLQETGDRRAYGARVVLVEDGLSRTQWVQPSMGFQGSGTAASLFALTPGAGQRWIEVTWPDGTLQVEQLEGRTGRIKIKRASR
ncbi:MAG: CRTAC1 family protein [Planctomycetota bacterium]|nr:CRTAC1 family protein [Planctomycetota bacterium]